MSFWHGIKKARVSLCYLNALGSGICGTRPKLRKPIVLFGFWQDASKKQWLLWHVCDVGRVPHNWRAATRDPGFRGQHLLAGWLASWPASHPASCGTRLGITKPLVLLCLFCCLPTEHAETLSFTVFLRPGIQKPLVFITSEQLESGGNNRSHYQIWPAKSTRPSLRNITEDP